MITVRALKCDNTNINYENQLLLLLEENQRLADKTGVPHVLIVDVPMTPREVLEIIKKYKNKKVDNNEKAETN